MKHLFVLILLIFGGCSTHKITGVRVVGDLGHPICGARVSFGSSASGHLLVDLAVGPTDSYGYVGIKDGFYVDSYTQASVFVAAGLIKPETSVMIIHPDFKFEDPGILVLKIKPDMVNMDSIINLNAGESVGFPSIRLQKDRK